MVTDDRELKLRVKGLGATSLGVAKFAERLRVESAPKSAAPAKPAEKKDKRLSSSEVDDWMQFFGFDENEDPTRENQ